MGYLSKIWSNMVCSVYLWKSRIYKGYQGASKTGWDALRVPCSAIELTALILWWKNMNQKETETTVFFLLLQEFSHILQPDSYPILYSFLREGQHFLLMPRRKTGLSRYGGWPSRCKRERITFILFLTCWNLRDYLFVAQLLRHGLTRGGVK